MQLTIVSVLLVAHQACGFGFGPLGGGGGCGCAAPAPAPAPACPPPACAAPPACAPTPVCPPPPPPPQTFCPPTPACQVCAPPAPPPCPAPPPPPPPCPTPPPPCPQVLVTCQRPQPPAQNDCCSGRGCGSSCRYKGRRALAFGAPINLPNEGEEKDLEIEQEGDDAMCNSEFLKAIMINNMSGDSAESKRAIQKSAEYKFEKKFDVICASGDFSYLVNSNLFCQTTLGDITCFAFQH